MSRLLLKENHIITGVFVYLSACTGTHCIYPQRHGQAELTMPTCNTNQIYFETARQYSR